MGYYRPNPACSCGRCATRGIMGPAVLITLGVLFLLGNVKNYPFDHTWPILLIVIGAVKVVRYVVPEQGHVNPGEYPYAGYPPYGVPGQYPPPPYPAGAYGAAAAAPVVNAVPVPEPETSPVPEAEKGENGEVQHG